MDVELVREVTQLLLVGLIGALGLGLRGLIGLGLKYLEGKIGAEKVADFKQYAVMGVRALAQSPAFEWLEPEKKKELLIMWLTDYAQQKKLPYDYQFIDKVAEEAVHLVKRVDLFQVSEIEVG
jgi:hypothetical protein